MLPCPLSASADLLLILLKYASQLGIDEESISTGCNVDLSAYKMVEARIPLHTFHSVWKYIRNAADDSDFGLHFGEQSHVLLSRHLIYAMMMNCESVEQAIRKNFLYHNLITDIIRPRVAVEEGYARLTWEMAHPSLNPERHLSESVLALFVSMLRFLTENRFELTEVRFAHDQPLTISEHQRLFQSRLVFGADINEIVTTRRTLATPIIPANAEILEGLELLVRKALHRVYGFNTWREKVAHELYKALTRENATDIDAIARRLAIGERSLQMKLKEEGTTFREIFETVRKEIATSYLREPAASLSEIALLLGFTDQSTFQHAFKRWTGKTPGDYRKNAQKTG